MLFKNLRPMSQRKGHINRAKNTGEDGPHQPADVVPSGAKNRMNGITHLALQPVPVHSVIVLEVTKHGLNGLASF